MRLRLLGPLQATLTMIVGQRMGGQLSVEQMLEKVRHSFGSYFSWTKAPHVSAFSRAIRKMSPEMSRAFFHELLSMMPSMRALSATLSPRWRFVAIDGCKVSMARTKEFLQLFGETTYHQKPGHYPQALLVSLWDMGGKAPLDWRLYPWQGNERQGILDMLPSLTAGDVLVADRNFPARYIFKLLSDHRVHFIMRMNASLGNCLREIRDFVASDAEEIICDCPLPDDSEQSHAATATRRLRFIAERRPGKKPLVIVTDILDAATLPAAQALQLYRKRWGIETAFREMKTHYGKARLSGRCLQAVHLEICAYMIQQLLTAEVTAEIELGLLRKDREEGIQRPPRRCNRHTAGFMVTQWLEDLHILSPQKLHEHIHAGVDYLRRLSFRERPGRSFPRVSKNTYSKWAVKGGVKGID